MAPHIAPLLPHSQAGLQGGDADSRAAILNDPSRLEAVHATGLLDSEVEETFDRLTRLAVRLVGVPAAFISVVDKDRDFYKSACGFGEPLASARELGGPTFCHYTVQRTTPLVIPDTAADPLYRDVPTVKTLGVAAYVGVPLFADGQPIGAFCAIDVKPRAWTDDEVEILVELATSAQREIELRTTADHMVRLSAAANSALLLAEKANRAKGEFLAVMSHELRTPLNAIGGYADLIRIGVHGPVTPDQHSALERIQRSQRHLLGLINGVLIYAQVDAGAAQYDLADVSLSETLAICEALVAPQAQEKNIDLHYEACDPEITAHADREKLQQIVVNLLSNAVKFTERGGHAKIDCFVADGGQVAIRVADNGCGVAPDDMERVFLPFVQVDGELTRRQGGTGLGLAISRDLARGMGGGLTIESTVGVGSTLTLTLPRASA